MGAAILAINAAALVALAYPLTAPYIARAASAVAKGTRRCCGPEAALLLSCAWPYASPSPRLERCRRGSGAASATGQAALQQLQLDVDGTTALTLHGCPIGRPGGLGQGTTVAAAELQREAVQLASGLQAVGATTQQTEGAPALEDGVQGAGTGQHAAVGLV